MKKSIFSLLMLLFVLSLNGQGDFDPYVESAGIDPKPINSDGTATFTFEVGNNGDDPLPANSGLYITIEIVLSYGIPDNDDPLNAIGGTAEEWFSWAYSDGVYTATQIQDIAPGTSGTITIAYMGTAGSQEDDPQNGFRVELTPANNQNTDDPENNVTSDYTWFYHCDDPPSLTLNGNSETACANTPVTVSGNSFGGSATNVEITENGAGSVTPSTTENSSFSFTYTPAPDDAGNTVTITVTTNNPAGAPCEPVTATYSITFASIPSAPDPGTTTQPTCETPTGSVVLSGLPSGDWTINPGDIEGSGSSYTVTGLEPGTYNFTVTNASGCVSPESDDVTIEEQPDAPSVILNGESETLCATVTPVTVSGNSFGGTATSVEITENGAGSVSPSNTTSSPFAFTYTPAPEDAGRTVIITVTTNNPAGPPCEPATATYSITFRSIPAPPQPGTPTQPTCETPSGSVVLNGLPAGEWIINPGEIEGSGNSYTVTGLDAGTYNFTVTNSSGCVSSASENVVIEEQPDAPAEPDVTVNCELGNGNATVTVSTPRGEGLEYRLNDGAYQTNPVFSGIANGTYTLTVRNAEGCTNTGQEFSVNCNCTNPPTVTLNGQNGTVCGTGTPVVISGNLFGGSATGIEISENGAGTVTPSSTSSSPFVITYTPADGDAGRSVTITVTTDNPLGFPCQAASATYTITFSNFPGAPVAGTVTHPTCSVSTGSVVLSGLPSSGTWTLTRTPGDVQTTGTGTSATISGLAPGTHNFTVTNAANCTSRQQTTITINPAPAPLPAPAIGTITQPTCTVSTGSVVLSGLPGTGTWSLLRNPGAVITSGTGASVTISGLEEGTYTFVVDNTSSCPSQPSANVVINPQPRIPSAPAIGTITQPTCSVSTGSVILNGLPSTGTWTLTRYPGTIVTTGTGSSTTISGLSQGTYNFTIGNSAGCISVLSSNIIIDAIPVTPAAPVVGTITQPTCEVTSGSVVLGGLPETGSWTVTRNPGSTTTSGSGTSATVSGLITGTYTFTVTTAQGCTSVPSANVVIVPNPSAPVITIHQPDPECSPATVDLTNPAITRGSTEGLTYSYWTDPAATIPYTTPAAATTGTYYIKGVSDALCADVKPVTVTITNRPTANAGVSQELEFVFETTLDANLPEEGQTGAWSVFRGAGTFINENNPKTVVQNLSVGRNILLWIVRNDVCEPVYDTVSIVVKDLTVPSLMTPNNDGRNDVLIIQGINNQIRTELLIFDRRGVKVFESKHYDNTWNGVDENGDPLPDDTYFFLIKTDGKSQTGFIVIRK